MPRHPPLRSMLVYSESMAPSTPGFLHSPWSRVYTTTVASLSAQLCPHWSSPPGHAIPTATAPVQTLPSLTGTLVPPPHWSPCPGLARPSIITAALVLRLLLSHLSYKPSIAPCCLRASLKEMTVFQASLPTSHPTPAKIQRPHALHTPGLCAGNALHWKPSPCLRQPAPPLVPTTVVTTAEKRHQADHTPGAVLSALHMSTL